MQAFWSTLVFPPFNVTIQNWLMLASKQISHSSTKVHLIFQVMTWARVLLLSLCSLNLAHVVADQALAEDLCKGQQGQMLWQNFSIVPINIYVFPLETLVPMGQQKRHQIQNEKRQTVFLHLPLTHSMAGLCHIITAGFSRERSLLGRAFQVDIS